MCSNNLRPCSPLRFVDASQLRQCFEPRGPIPSAAPTKRCHLKLHPLSRVRGPCTAQSGTSGSCSSIECSFVMTPILHFKHTHSASESQTVFARFLMLMAKATMLSRAHMRPRGNAACLFSLRTVEGQTNCLLRGCAADAPTQPRPPCAEPPAPTHGRGRDKGRNASQRRTTTEDVAP